MGIIGTGWVSREHIKAFNKNPGTKVVAICSRSPEKAEAVRAEFGIDRAYGDHLRLLEDRGVDLVSICSPNYLHHSHALDSVKAGKHILVEKPMCDTAAQSHEIVGGVERAGVKLMVGHVARFVPMFSALKKTVEQGLLGDLFYAEGDYQHYVEPFLALWSWAKYTKYGRGMFLAGGTHIIDLLLWYMGDVSEVFGYAGNYVRGDISSDGDKETPDRREDTGVAVMKFRNGGIGKVLTSVGAKKPYKFHLTLFGTQGTFDDGLLYSDRIPGLMDKDVIRGSVKLPIPSLREWEVQYHPFQEEIDHFVDCILQDKRPLSDANDGAKVMEVTDAFYRSVKEHRPVGIPAS